MVAKLYCTRRLQFRDGWTLVTRLKFALAALIAIGVPGAAAAASHTIALFPSASSPHWTGFARVINHSEGSGTVRITGIDDAGREHGPVELELEDRAAAHFNSRDLEEGNAGKGLSDGLGDGEGDWRLRLESELAVEVLSYVRTGDGFVTAMHEGGAGAGTAAPRAVLQSGEQHIAGEPTEARQSDRERGRSHHRGARRRR